MLLATRCPHCETIFRLREEQLPLQGGLVRCGHCQQIFDAAQALVKTDLESAAAPTQTQAPAAAPQGVANARPRLFTASDTAARAPGQPGHRNFAPGAWDMWGAWLDGGVDPKVQTSGANVHPSPLVPVNLPEPPTPEEPPPGVVRFGGEPIPFETAAAAAAAPQSGDIPSVPPLSATHTDGPIPSAAVHTGEPPRDDAARSGEPPRGASEPSLFDIVAERAAAGGRGTAYDPHEPHFTAPPDTAPSAEGSSGTTPFRAEPFAAEPFGAEPFGAEPFGAEPFAAVPENDGREHFALTREARAGASGGGFWRVLGWLVALVLVVLLGAQLAWWQRETVLVYWPQSERIFRQACASLGCTLAPPRAIDGLRLDASDLRQVDGPRVLELKVPLTNRLGIALAYPSIELTLLDAANRITARRVLAPSDYMPAGSPIDAGIAPSATQVIRVRIDTNGVAASNYRVQIFYP